MPSINNLINDFDNVRIGDEHNTVVRQYKCPNCEREWESTTRKNIQQCRSCLQRVQPEIQTPVRPPIIPANKTLEELKGVRMFGFYICPKCRIEWGSQSSWLDHSQKCHICLRRVYPYKLKQVRKPRVPENITIEELKDERLFGFYRCLICVRRWCSASSWVDYSQNCKICFQRVYPYRLQRRARSEGDEKQEEEYKNKNKKPHREDLCSKCRKLKYPCFLE